MTDFSSGRYVIIANPTAGRSKSQHIAQTVSKFICQSGAQCEVCYTQGKGDARRIADQIISESTNQPPILVACGGDGTIQEIVHSIMTQQYRPVPLGIIPAGRCNDFASALQLPSDPIAIVEVLRIGRLRPIDIGRINDQYFCTICAFGFDAAVSRYVNDTALPLSGTPAYIWGTIRQLLRYQAVPVRLQFDHDQFEGPVFLVASANTPSYGGRMYIAPSADPADGLLDICVIEQVTRWQGLRLLQRVLNRQHRPGAGIHFFRSRTVKIETREPSELWADGEYLTHTPAMIELLPQRLSVVVG